MAEVGMNVENLSEVLAGLDQTKPNVAKAVNSTCKEFKSRAPGWINKAVTQEYAIKAGDVKESLKAKHNCGSTSLGGVTLDDIRLEYRGSVLTFTHFKFSPKKPAGFRTGRKAKGIIPGQYTNAGRDVVWAFQRKKTNLKVTVKKGHKEALSGRYDTTPFVASMKGSPVLPFQRKNKERSSATSLRSLSVPQMIMNEKVTKDINKRIDEELGKRLQHHLDRYSMN